MKFTIILICVIVGIYGKTTVKPKTKDHNSAKICSGVLVHGKLHKRHVIMNGINRPYQLAIYNHEHKIFFSYNVGEDTQDTFGIAYVKINDTMPTEIHGIKNGFAVVVDEHNKTAYFGGSEGIYADNLEKPGDLKHIVKDRDIWELQYIDHHLYFIEYPSQRLHKYDFKHKNVTLQQHIHEKIYQFVIDGEGDTFITTKDGLFEIKKGIKKPSTENQLFHVQHINAKFRQEYRHLRLLWDEAGQTIEYSLYFKNDSAGYWQVFNGQNGTLTSRPTYQQFSGTIQVLKAVNDHLLLNFCQDQVNGKSAQLYSVLFSREPGFMERWELDSVHALLQNKKLSVASRRMVCGNSAGKPVFSLASSFIFLILTFVIKSY